MADVNVDDGVPAVAKLTDWLKEPTLDILKKDLEDSRTSHDNQVSRIRKWDSLLKVTGDARPPKSATRSSIQPKIIRRQAEWRYSALSEPFLNTDSLFKIHPVTFEDTAAAKQNELLLNWQFRTKLNKIKFIDDYIRAVVDEGTCIARVAWERVIKTMAETVPVWTHYGIESPEQAEVLTQALTLKAQDPRSYNETVDPAVKAAVDYFENTQVPTYALQSGTQQVEKEIVVENKPVVEILNPMNVYIDPSCNGDLLKALFVIVSFETNQADLIKSGKYSNLDAIDWANVSSLVDPDHATSTPQEYQNRDPLRRRIVAYEYWGFYDIHGNNELVPIVATWIGSTLIRLEENEYPDKKLPFVLVPYSPVKRELYGEPDAELLEDNQRIMGALLRGMVDLVGKSANGQQGMAKGLLDPLNKRRFDSGQNYEFNPVNNIDASMVTHKFPEIPASAFNMLAQQNQEVEAMTGTKSFSDGMNGTSYGSVATGIKSVLDAAAKREMSILRRLAKGISEIGNKIIAMNAVFLSDVEVIRVTNNEFVPIMREDLAGNFDSIVDISTAEVDNMKAQDLGFMLQTIGPNEDPAIRRMLLSEIADLKRMPELAQKLRTYVPEPNPMQELELQRVQLEIEEIKSQILLNQAKAKEAGANADNKNLDFVEERNGIKHQRAMEQTQAQAQGNKELEIVKSLLQPTKPDEQGGDINTALGLTALTQ